MIEKTVPVTVREAEGFEYAQKSLLVSFIFYRDGRNLTMHAEWQT